VDLNLLVFGFEGVSVNADRGGRGNIESVESEADAIQEMAFRGDLVVSRGRQGMWSMWFDESTQWYSFLLAAMSAMVIMWRTG